MMIHLAKISWRRRLLATLAVAAALVGGVSALAPAQAEVPTAVLAAAVPEPLQLSLINGPPVARSTDYTRYEWLVTNRTDAPASGAFKVSVSGATRVVQPAGCPGGSCPAITLAPHTTRSYLIVVTSNTNSSELFVEAALEGTEQRSRVYTMFNDFTQEMDPAVSLARAPEYLVAGQPAKYTWSVVNLGEETQEGFVTVRTSLDPARFPGDRAVTASAGCAVGHEDGTSDGNLVLKCAVTLAANASREIGMTIRAGRAHTMVDLMAGPQYFGDQTNQAPIVTRSEVLSQ